MSHREKPECVMEGTTFAKTEKSARDQIKSLFKNSRMCLTDPLKQTQVLYEASRVALVNYKLELARGICPLPLQRLVLCWCSCWPSKCPESSSGWRVRHSVLQGNWGNRPLDRYFQELIFWPQSLHLLIFRKALNPFMVTSVQLSHSTMSDALWPHEPQHARPPCPSPTPKVHPNPSPLSQLCHPTILSSVVPFYSHLQSVPASGYFQMSQLFASGGQSIEVSASISVLPMNIQDWFPLGWTDWISLQSKGLSRVFSNTTVPKHQFFSTLLSL